MMTCNCIESERFLLRVKIKGEPDVSIRAVARNIFRWAKTVNRKTLSKRFGLRTVLSKNQFGAHDRRETVWRRRSEVSLWSFKDFIGSCNAGPKPPLRGNGSELNSPSNMFFGLPLRFKSVLRNSGRICLVSRSQGNVRFASSSTTERARLPH